MALITLIFQLVATIAIIVFIIHTTTIHRRLQEHINNLDKILKDHEVYLNNELEFRSKVEDVLNKCVNFLNRSNNTNLEVLSKIRNKAKDKENKYNNLLTRLTSIANLINVNYNAINDLKIQAKFSYNTEQMMFTLPETETQATKPKTANTKRFSRVNGITKKNKKN